MFFGVITPVILILRFSVAGTRTRVDGELHGESCTGYEDENGHIVGRYNVVVNNQEASYMMLHDITPQPGQIRARFHGNGTSRYGKPRRTSETAFLGRGLSTERASREIFHHLLSPLRANSCQDRMFAV
nr:hypothetical protein CFP56_04398 [Quercus suber]